MTAFTATFSTVYSHASRVPVGRMRPTTRSAGWLVPASIAATRSSVGRMIGSWSVQPCSRNCRCRLSSLAGSTKRGVLRPKLTCAASAADTGRVIPSSTSLMNGRPVIASVPST